VDPWKDLRQAVTVGDQGAIERTLLRVSNGMVTFWWSDPGGDRQTSVSGCRLFLSLIKGTQQTGVLIVGCSSQGAHQDELNYSGRGVHHAMYINENVPLSRHWSGSWVHQPLRGCLVVSLVGGG
jgi:hypothetical protein